IQSNVNIILNAGVMPKTLEEAEAIDYFNSNREFKNKQMELEYQKEYIRESRRLFRYSKFDYVYNYETDSDYWNYLLEAIKFNNTSTIRIYCIYLRQWIKLYTIYNRKTKCQNVLKFLLVTEYG